MPDIIRQLTFVDALREGLDQAMAQDSRVIVIGEGVPDPKAIFNTTAGLREKYGNKRVFDMPLAENGLTGACIGAAIAGLRPVMIHQRIDFAMLAMDQIINNAAKWHYMFDGKSSVPLVVRMIVGRGWGQGPQHSQSLQALFAHIPGLKVVMPTTAHDAKGLMIAAIEDDNPVIFIEHRWLHHVKDDVPEAYYRVPIGKARVLQQGDSVTIAAFSYMAFESLIAARALLAELEIAVEVLDMRSARPLDVDSVLESVSRTGRLIVADTAHKTGGVAGELVAQVTERAFGSLRKAPIRIASPDYPAPSSPFMTEHYYPEPWHVAEAVLSLLNMELDADRRERLLAVMKRNGPHDVPNRDFSGPF